jgi:hypothetical protein
MCVTEGPLHSLFSLIPFVPRPGRKKQPFSHRVKGRSAPRIAQGRWHGRGWLRFLEGFLEGSGGAAAAAARYMLTTEYVLEFLYVSHVVSPHS